MSQQVFPGKWKSWATHGATNYTAFLRWPEGRAADRRIAVALHYKKGQSAETQWGRLDRGGAVLAFVFDTPIEDAQEIQLEVVLLEPLHAEFVVHPELKPAAHP